MFNINIFKKGNKIRFTPKKYVLFNVDTFNMWFNDKENNAEYSHSGIYLRPDKLSECQVKDYLVKCHGLDLNEWGIEKEISDFAEEIRKNWFKNLQGKARMIKKKFG